jgi:hypothetical protein
MMFGPGDALLTTLIRLLRLLPIFPLFGEGLTRLQPVYVGDVRKPWQSWFCDSPPLPIYEIGGLQVAESGTDVVVLLPNRKRLRHIEPRSDSARATVSELEVIPAPLDDILQVLVPVRRTDWKARALAR